MQSHPSLYHPAFIASVVNLTTWQRQLMATSIATLLMALAANISIPTYPVPFSLQSMAVLLVGGCLGRKLGTLALLQYLFAGFIGLPVFANGSGGFMTLYSPSVGYLYGYVFSAYLAGLAAELGYDRRLFSGLIAFACAHQMLFIVGVIYLAVYYQIDIMQAIAVGYLPFMGFDALKFVLASMIMLALWRYRNRVTKSPWSK